MNMYMIKGIKCFRKVELSRDQVNKHGVTSHLTKDAHVVFMIMLIYHEEMKNRGRFQFLKLT